MAQQRSPELVTGWMADVALPSRQGVAIEILSEDDHRIRQRMMMRKADQQVHRPIKHQGRQWQAHA